MKKKKTFKGNNSSIDRIVKKISIEINLVPKFQKFTYYNGVDELEYKEKLNSEIIYSIIYSWFLNKSDFLTDSDNIEEYIDELFQKVLGDYGITSEDEMTPLEYKEWKTNYTQLRQILMDDASVDKSCQKLKNSVCKKPNCVWVNKKRKYCRKAKNTKKNLLRMTKL